MVDYSANTSGETKDLAYDLRQIYARLLGEHLIDASDARKANNFFNWYKALEDIKTISAHKFKDKIKAIETYNKKIVEIKKVANLYPNVWLGKTKVADQIEKIEKLLRDLEEFLYSELEKGKVFGESARTPGL